MTTFTLNAALLAAAKNDDWATAKKAIEAGANVMTTDENGDCASILFAMHGNSRAVIGLAKVSKATLDMTDKGGNTAGICLALANNGTAAVAVASEYPHILRQKNNRNSTMATWFCRYQNIQAVYALACLNGGVFAQTDDEGAVSYERFKHHADAETFSKLKDLEIRRRSNW